MTRSDHVNFIINPRSGSQSFPTTSHSIEQWLHSRPGKLSLLDHNSVLEPGLNIIGGGDGTLGSFLAKSLDRPDVTIGFIPLGTGNDLCRELGITTSSVYRLHDYLNTLLDGSLEKLALWEWQHGMHHGIFVNYISMGLDSYVVERFSTLRHRDRFPFRNLGKLGNRCAYLYEALKHVAVSLPTLELTYPTGHQPLPSASGILFCNVRSYMGLGKSNTLSNPFDTLLEACLLPNPLTYLKTMYPWLPFKPPLFLGSHPQWEIRTLPPGLPIQSDGEFVCMSESKPLIIRFKGFAQVLLPQEGLPPISK